MLAFIIEYIVVHVFMHLCSTTMKFIQSMKMVQLMHKRDDNATQEKAQKQKAGAM